MPRYNEFPPYVSAAERRQKVLREQARRKKKGLPVEPVTITGRGIAQSFWGKAWCDHLEGYSDYENRLPRGRTYVRNGSVLHLGIAPGRIEAMVQGSTLYEVSATITPLARPRWKAVVEECSGKIDSLVELLRGQLSDGVMRVVTHRDKGLFPSPSQIEMKCSCPDWASMCKHIAAVLYGIGARLDERPELLFTLRKVDHLELLSAGGTKATTTPARSKRADAETIASSDLGGIFGIEIESEPEKTGKLEKAGKPEKPKKPKTGVRRSPARAKVSPASAGGRRRT